MRVVDVLELLAAGLGPVARRSPRRGGGPHVRLGLLGAGDAAIFDAARAAGAVVVTKDVACVGTGGEAGSRRTVDEGRTPKHGLAAVGGTD